MKAHVRIELHPDKATFARWRDGSGNEHARSAEAWSEAIARNLLTLEIGPVDSVEVIVRSENGYMFPLAEYERDADKTPGDACQACEGRGWLHMDDSCGNGPGIERCDDCKRYETDEDAADAHAKACTCDDAEKARRLAGQWPKVCGCRRVYVPREDLRVTTPGLMAWEDLPLATTRNAPDGTFKDAFATHEMRNCACGSTLVILTAIHDLKEE